MRTNRNILAVLFSVLTFTNFGMADSRNNPYLWLDCYDLDETIEKRILVPEGYSRIPVESGSYQDWLRKFPLKNGRPPVYLYNGKKKRNQRTHVAVLDIDVGDRDLQQCADAVIRLRAEYLYSRGRYDDIRFRFTSGDLADFSKWVQGYRPVVKGNQVQWIRSASSGSGYSALRSYLETVFLYAGSYSLSQELRPVADRYNMRIGDVFITGGFPGHAVVVVDMAEHAETGERIFLLAQSYMPAQDIHLLRNSGSFASRVLVAIRKLFAVCSEHNIRRHDVGNPWYPITDDEELKTPQWTFRWNDLKRF